MDILLWFTGKQQRCGNNAKMYDCARSVFRY